MKDLIQKVLAHCGYDLEPTEESLKECFLDYVDSGSFGNLTVQEAEEEIEDGEITLKMMCINLLKVR